MKDNIPDHVEKIEGKDYKFLYDYPIEHKLAPTPIQILTGSYKGVIFHFGVVHTFELPPQGTPNDDVLTLSFDYTLLDYPTEKYSKKDLEKSKDFTRAMGYILTSILVKAAKDHDELREDNTDSFDNGEKI